MPKKLAPLLKFPNLETTVHVADWYALSQRTLESRILRLDAPDARHTVEVERLHRGQISLIQETSLAHGFTFVHEFKVPFLLLTTSATEL
jgi:hypothetical protein